MNEAGEALHRSRNPVRQVSRASLFDGYSGAITIMRRLLQAQGAEVIHLGHNRSVEEEEEEVAEDVQGLAISSHQGATSGTSSATLPSSLEGLLASRVGDLARVITALEAGRLADLLASAITAAAGRRQIPVLGDTLRIAILAVDPTRRRGGCSSSRPSRTSRGKPSPSRSGSSVASPPSASRRPTGRATRWARVSRPRRGRWSRPVVSPRSTPST